MPPRRWELDGDPWCKIRPSGQDWELYSRDGLAQVFKASKYGSSDKAKEKARQEKANRNRRIERIRRDWGLPNWRSPV